MIEEKPGQTPAKKPFPKTVRGLFYLAAGAAVAIPLAACQPEPAKPAQHPMDSSTMPATRTTVTDESGVRTVIKEVIVEKPVYIEKPAAPGTGDDEVLATLGTGADERKITFSQIKPLLTKAYGLNILRQYIQLDMVKHVAQQRNITVTSEDIDAESDKWLAQISPDAEKNEYPNLLSNLLQRQHLTRAEYDLAMEINAYFRKLAQSQMKTPPSEETLREAFNLTYGEKVQIRHIECNNIGEITECQKLLAAGMPFEEVAKTKSRNHLSGPLGGELTPFTRTAAGVPESMRDTAFALKEGEVSDPVLADGKYHLLKLDKKIPPKAVKFEDVRDSVEKELRKKAEDGIIKEYRNTLASQAIESMNVVDPELKKQWDALKRQAEAEKAKASSIAPGTAK